MVKCDRCQNEINIHSMSWFNKDTICNKCSDEEEKHSHFHLAKIKENEEVKKGNFNYPGFYANLSWDEIKRKK
jgi:hypothetical protein